MWEPVRSGMMVSVRADAHTTHGADTAMHRPQSRQSSIGQQFMTYGPETINVHYAQQRRLQQAALAGAMKRPGQHLTVRQWLGTLMISLGTAIAGGAAMIQERQAAQQATATELAPSR